MQSSLKHQTEQCRFGIPNFSNFSNRLSGVSIKIDVASALDRVTDYINKGPLVPFSGGGGGAGGLGV